MRPEKVNLFKKGNKYYYFSFPPQLAALMRAGKDLDESLGCSPLIYGNDVDSVDIATRVALVRNIGDPVLYFNKIILLGSILQF